ncbi:MFS transporter [Pseudokineococcus sp. 1T1Z-3]|uniref:MFS transporter n=1 Tax=Pseudokineococcus sp. 1T1Z-3 TaxID=3132745 RepID=UPI00309F89B2
MSGTVPAPGEEKVAGRAAVLLGTGIVVLEFAAAVGLFTTGTLLPVIRADLDAGAQVPALVAGASIGTFVSLPLASRVLALASPGRVLLGGLLLAGAGAAVSVLAPGVWIFFAGRFLSGLAAGLFAVYGLSAAIRLLTDRVRLRVIALTSLMWVVPALVGPPLALGVEHLAGWRVAFLVPVPLVVLGRVLVVRVVPPDPAPQQLAAPLRRSLLVPLGATVFVLVSGSALWPLALVGFAAMLVGLVALVPEGTARLARGAPAGLAAMTLLATGYFGADGLVTLMLTDVFDASPPQAAVVLSAGPLGWATGALVTARLRPDGVPPVLGLTVVAGSVLGVGTLGLAGAPWVAALAVWAAGGLGVGLAYATLLLRATTQGPGLAAVALATGVIVAESFGILAGGALGGALAAAGEQLGVPTSQSLAVAFLLLGTLVAAAALASLRSARVPSPVAA